ncbi:hypothetical protein B0H17DRAFT_1213650 [Mycena rosella]|uniref:Uncharacterized protein n=1 Tax=Mycena rosella TaxID=1033263 RepID=A0AAD7G171_MYCRO|nr:hypothetical protein B0H17DRAFT_1213650 [Mycena rosella]
MFQHLHSVDSTLNSEENRTTRPQDQSIFQVPHPHAHWHWQYPPPTHVQPTRNPIAHAPALPLAFTGWDDPSPHAHAHPAFTPRLAVCLPADSNERCDDHNVFRLVAVRVHASSRAACVRGNNMYTTGLGPAPVSSFLRGRQRHCSRASSVLDSRSASPPPWRAAEPQSYLAVCLHQYNTNADGGGRASHHRPP